MPRPPKDRRVEYLPEVTFFKPAGIPMRELDEVVLTIEELEAIRLKDLCGLEQNACAERMDVSRPTFQRVLTSARSKVAEGLVNGKAIRVEGGTYRLATVKIRCIRCDEEIEVPMRGRERRNQICPDCSVPGRIYRRKHRHGNPSEDLE
jgi:predicted DNA-binding protein (UPF0251 family)